MESRLRLLIVAIGGDRRDGPGGGSGRAAGHTVYPRPGWRCRNPPARSPCRSPRFAMSRWLDVQARNLAEGQADIAIRGGIFENTGFRIGGAALYDPQTGHYSAEIPVAPAMISAPRILTGVDNALGGFNADVGTIAYDWQRIRARGEMTVAAGQYDSYARQPLPRGRERHARGRPHPGGRRRGVAFDFGRLRAVWRSSISSATTCACNSPGRLRRPTCSTATRRSSSAGPTSTRRSVPTKPRIWRPCWWRSTTAPAGARATGWRPASSGGATRTTTRSIASRPSGRCIRTSTPRGRTARRVSGHDDLGALVLGYQRRGARRRSQVHLAHFRPLPLAHLRQDRPRPRKDLDARRPAPPDAQRQAPPTMTPIVMLRGFAPGRDRAG